MHRKLIQYQGKTLRDLFTERQRIIQESQNFSQGSASISDCLYHPGDLWHVYLKLDFEPKYENASNLKDATSFLRNVGKAALLAETVFSEEDGIFIEAQGSMIHLLLPGNLAQHALVDVCRALDYRLDNEFNQHAKVNGWRMTADAGKTILVESNGIHDDSSFVSLGKSANRPAKFLYKEILSQPEERRVLKRRHLGIFNTSTGGWNCQDLSLLKENVKILIKTANFSAVELDVQVRGISSIIKQAQAVQIEEGQGKPTNEMLLWSLLKAFAH